MKTLSSDVQLRSKKELIERFIEESLPEIEDLNQIDNAFYSFWDKEKISAFNELCNEEKLNPEKLAKIIEMYIFTEKKPLRDDVVHALEYKLGLLQRSTVVSRVTKKIMKFVDVYITGVGNNEE